MANIYLQVDYQTGNIFQYSKEKQDGFDSHTNSKGVESFRKIYNKGLYGILKGVTVRDTNFGKEVSVAAQDKDNNNVYLSLPLFDAKKNLASYAESFIGVLPNLKVGSPYRFFAYNIKEEGQKYSKVGVSVVPADIQAETVDKENAPKKLTYTYTKDGVEVKGDIPSVVWEEDFDGSVTMNAKAKNKYLYDILMANISEAPAATSNSEIGVPPPKKQNTVVETAAGIQKEEDKDLLPF